MNKSPRIPRLNSLENEVGKCYDNSFPKATPLWSKELREHKLPFHGVTVPPRKALFSCSKCAKCESLIQSYKQIKTTIRHSKINLNLKKVK